MYVYFFSDFNYVVEIITEQKICFGSTSLRNTNLIGKGLSPFQKRTMPELFKQGPGAYHSEKYTSALYPILYKVSKQI